jgi:hypothetical protein
MISQDTDRVLKGSAKDGKGSGDGGGKIYQSGRWYANSKKFRGGKGKGGGSSKGYKGGKGSGSGSSKGYGGKGKGHANGGDYMGGKGYSGSSKGHKMSSKSGKGYGSDNDNIDFKVYRLDGVYNFNSYVRKKWNEHVTAKCYFGNCNFEYPDRCDIC